MAKDGVVRIQNYWYAMVNQKLYGPWICKEYANAGLEVEQRREAKKYIKNVPWTPHCNNS